MSDHTDDILSCEEEEANFSEENAKVYNLDKVTRRSVTSETITGNTVNEIQAPKGTNIKSTKGTYKGHLSEKKKNRSPKKAKPKKTKKNDSSNVIVM